MSESEISEQQRRQVSIVLQVAGLFDVFLGVAFAVFAPAFFGGDATIDLVLRGVGGAMALSGVAMWWWGRSRRNAAASTRRSGPVVWRRR